MQYMQEDGSEPSKGSGKSARGGSNTGLVMLGLLAPIVLPLLGLACAHSSARSLVSPRVRVKRTSSVRPRVLTVVAARALLPDCYWAASKEGLADVLKGLKKTREKARKRRGTKAGGNFRQRQKLSQDGKGGRSANS